MNGTECTERPFSDVSPMIRTGDGGQFFYAVFRIEMMDHVARMQRAHAVGHEINLFLRKLVDVLR